MQKVSFNVSCKAGLVVTNSFSFYLSGKLFITPSILNTSFAEYSIVDWRFFTFSTLSITCHSLLACQLCVEKFPCILIYFPFFIKDFFCLPTFKFFFLSVHCGNLIAIYIGIDLLLLILMGVLCVSWIWMSIFFLSLDTFSNIISTNKFYAPFSISFSATHIVQMLFHLMESLSSLCLFSCCIILFRFCSASFFYITLSSMPIIHSSASSSLLYIAPTLFLISVSVSVSVCLDCCFKFSIRHVTYICFG